MIHGFRNLLSVLLAAGYFALSGSSALAGDEKDKQAKATPGESEPSVWMKKKLEYSQNILSGIATADFDKIAASAQALQGLSKIEAFVRSRTPGYRTQLEIFMDANAEIIRQANDDNVDGAALAFTQMTISCVNCHKQLRAPSKK